MPANPDSPRPVKLIDWGTFRLEMFANGTYQRVSASTSNQRAVSRLEDYFIAEFERWEIAVQLWGLMMAGCPQSAKASATELEVWQGIAAAAHMPFSFSSIGEMEVIGDS